MASGLSPLSGNKIQDTTLSFTRFSSVGSADGREIGVQFAAGASNLSLLRGVQTDP